MDIPVIIAAAVLCVIAAIEIICLLWCSDASRDITVTAAFPCFHGKDELEKLLKYIELLITDGTERFDMILLIDYGLDDEEKEMCFSFCNEYQPAEIIGSEDMPYLTADMLHGK